MAAAAAFAELDQCLQWISFTYVQHHNSIIAEGGFNGLNDFFDITETDIRDMAESFSKRSPAASRINFGMLLEDVVVTRRYVRMFWRR